MGTRGLLGIRGNKELFIGRYNHYDSYYDELGNEVINLYFLKNGSKIIELTDNKEDDKEFLQDGLFCEYAYIYNEDNDTLEIYRGFFENRQNSNIKKEILDSIEGKDKHYCHLVMVVDKKKHTYKKVLKAFKKYNDSDEDERIDYPEHDIIPLELNDDYVFLV